MLRLPKRDTKLLVAVHGWSGVMLGMLLYAVVATGTAAVLAHEIGTWSAGVIDTRSALNGPVDATLRRLAAMTPAREYEAVDLFDTTTHELGVFFHHHDASAGTPVDRGIYYEVARGGQVKRRLEGTGEEVYGPDDDSALGRFLVDTHVRLHVPDPWGLILTGVVGLAMLVAAISGLLIHRHILKDAFTLRRRAHPVLAARDRHSVAGTWSLPFAFVLAFTGSFFSFAGSVGLPTVAAVAFGGDQMKMLETLGGAPASSDARVARPGDLDRMLADAHRRAGVGADYVSIADWGRMDATVSVSHPPRPGELDPQTMVYDGPTGRFAREKPSLGSRPSFGGALFALMGPLHFGSFAGLLSKAIWVGLGFATCFVTISGLRLWLRRRDGLAALARATTVTAFGLPMALTASAWGALLAMPEGNAVAWTPRAFIAAALMAIAAGVFTRDDDRLAFRLRTITGLGILALPAVRLLVGGPGWGRAAPTGTVIIGMDLTLVITGLAFLWPSLMRNRATNAAPMPLQAAE